MDKRCTDELNQIIMKEKLIAKGTLTLEFAIESEDSYDSRRLEFNPPLTVEWSVYEEEGNGKVAHVYYDFGLHDTFSVEPDKNCLLLGYYGLRAVSPVQEMVEKNVIFDLFHAFTHCDMDPNYTHLHWALYGNLKDKTKVIENYC